MEDIYCRIDIIFPEVNDEITEFCRPFSLIYNIFTGVVVVLLLAISLAFVDIKQS